MQIKVVYQAISVRPLNCFQNLIFSCEDVGVGAVNSCAVVHGSWRQEQRRSSAGVMVAPTHVLTAGQKYQQQTEHENACEQRHAK